MATGADIVLETERLFLRRFREEDLDALVRWNADPRFYRFMGRKTPDETLATLDRWERHWAEHGFGLLAVEERESGALVGRSGVAFHRWWPADPEVGWAVDPDRWGSGIATEAGAACMRWALHDLGYLRVVSIIHPDNAPSLRVAAKLGSTVFTEVEHEPWGRLLVYALDRDES
jgi:RimJ/RimL family protein N-acetyltransferase